MARPPKAPLDDDYEQIEVKDFAGGFISAMGAFVLGSNTFSKGLNFIHLPGRCLYRGGSTGFAVMPAPADHVFYFKDTSGDPHFAVWAGGSLYDCISGAPVLVEGGCYSAPHNVGADVSGQGILFWSCGYPNPVPLRFWNPTAGTTGPIVGNLVPAGSVDPPASDFIFTYAGSLIALAPYWGAPLTADVFQPNVFAASNVNDFSTWIANQAVACGPNNGGRLTYGRQFGISDAGISPERKLIIFRDDQGVYSYSGAVGSFVESTLNCDIGLQDPLSVQYVPTKGEFGVIVWLGNDGQFWRTNGVNCLPISAQQILPTLASAFYQATISGANQRFCSGYNEEWQYYWCNVNGVQFVWRWVTESWALFQGWPIGVSFTAPDPNTGVRSNFVAGQSKVNLQSFQLDSSFLGGIDVLADSPSGNIEAYLLAKIGVPGVGDMGIMPPIYWEGPVFYGGSISLFKRFAWAFLSTLNTGGQYTMTGRSIARQDGNIQTSKSIVVQAPTALGANDFTLDSSLLGGPDILADPVLSQLQPGVPVYLKGRLAIDIPASLWWSAGHTATLNAQAMILRVERSGGSNVFDLLSAGVLYKTYGFKRGGGAPFNSEAVTNLPFDPFYFTGPTSDASD